MRRSIATDDYSIVKNLHAAAALLCGGCFFRADAYDRQCIAGHMLDIYGLWWYNIIMDNRTFIMGGRAVRQDSFACIVAVMLTVAAVAADMVFRVSAVTEMFVYDIVGYDALYIASGITAALGMLAFAAMLLVTRSGRMGSLPLFIPLCVVAVGFLLNMIFSFLVRGSFHMSIEILLFVFSIVAVIAVALTSWGITSPFKATVVLGSASVLSIVAAFVPYFTGDFSIAESLGCLPFAVMLGAVAFAVSAQSGEAPQHWSSDHE